jgi:hypothetical protein
LTNSTGCGIIISERDKRTKQKEKEIIKMFERFDEIFGEVMVELNLTGWWELFDSEDFDEVERRICEVYGVEDASEVEGFIDWYNQMAADL